MCIKNEEKFSIEAVFRYDFRRENIVRNTRPTTLFKKSFYYI